MLRVISTESGRKPQHAFELVAILMPQADNPGPAIELDVVPRVKRSAYVGTVLPNSFGFGGQNACLVMAREPV